MMRGPIPLTEVPPASPNSESRISLCPYPPEVARKKLVWLKMLNAAASNFRLNRSVSLKFLDRVMSADQKPGPTKVLRPRLPRQPRQGAEKVGRPLWPEPAQPFAHVEWVPPDQLDIVLSGRSFRPPVRR